MRGCCISQVGWRRQKKIENHSGWEVGSELGESLHLELTSVGDMTVTHETIQECFRAGHKPGLCLEAQTVCETRPGGQTRRGEWLGASRVMGHEDQGKVGPEFESWAESELVFLHVLGRASAKHYWFVMELLSTYCVPGTVLDVKCIMWVNISSFRPHGVWQGNRQQSDY